jgi:hypothetical protein
MTSSFRSPDLRFPVAAKGRTVRRQPGTMNKTEAQYAASLETQKLAGEVLAYWFDSIKLRLAESTFYTPDFMVLRPDGQVEIHEVKGHWEDDARVKIKVAASLFPFAFLAVTAMPKREGGGWKVEAF